MNRAQKAIVWFVLSIGIFGQKASAQASSAPSGAAAAADETSSPLPQHPITREQVQMMLQQTHMLDMMVGTVHRMIPMQKQAMPYLPDVFWDQLESEFAKEDWLTVLTPIYQKHLSQEDAAKVIEFYSTPAGQHVLTATPLMMQEAQAAGQAKGREIGERVGEQHRAEIEAWMQKYKQDHPESNLPPGAPPPAQPK
jgi:hypothetical protein